MRPAAPVSARDRLTRRDGLLKAAGGGYAIGGRNSLAMGCGGMGNCIGSGMRMDSKRTTGTVTTAAMSAYVLPWSPPCNRPWAPLAWSASSCRSAAESSWKCCWLSAEIVCTSWCVSHQVDEIGLLTTARNSNPSSPARSRTGKCLNEVATAKLYVVGSKTATPNHKMRTSGGRRRVRCLDSSSSRHPAALANVANRAMTSRFVDLAIHDPSNHWGARTTGRLTRRCSESCTAANYSCCHRHP